MHSSSRVLLPLPPLPTLEQGRLQASLHRFIGRAVGRARGRRHDGETAVRAARLLCLVILPNGGEDGESTKLHLLRRAKKGKKQTSLGRSSLASLFKFDFHAGPSRLGENERPSLIASGSGHSVSQSGGPSKEPLQAEILVPSRGLSTSPSIDKYVSTFRFPRSQSANTVSEHSMLRSSCSRG